MNFLNNYSKLFCFVQLLSILFVVLPVVAEEDVQSNIMLEEKQWVGDLDQLTEKGAIRILVPVSNPDFFVDGFRKYGNTPVLVKEFQEYLNKNITTDTYVRAIIIPANRSTIIDRLRAGYGDLVVANLTITEERLKKVDFATPMYTGIKEIIVASPESPVLYTLNDLSGKTVATRLFTSYHEHLLRLNKQFKAQGLAPVNIKIVADELEDDILLALVNEGIASYIVLDQRKMELWKTVYDKAIAYPDIAIDTGGEIAWVLRKNSPQLLYLVSNFSNSRRDASIDMEALRRSTEKEFIHLSNLKGDTIQKFIELYPIFVKAGADYSIPPLVLAALAFERSGFSEEKSKPNGGLGIMRIAPFIEREMGGDITARDESDELVFHIALATKYLARLRDDNFKDLANDPKQQLFFVLAAYLNGPAKINEMRWITAKMGKNGNKWFNEVNVTVSRLIGRETVRSVRNIALYWVAYQMAIESGKIVLPGDIQ